MGVKLPTVELSGDSTVHCYTVIDLKKGMGLSFYICNTHRQTCADTDNAFNATSITNLDASFSLRIQKSHMRQLYK